MSLLDDLEDGPLRDAMLAIEPELAEEMLRDYYAADAATQADILAFFTSHGQRIVKELRQQQEDGTPPSHELEKWLRG